MQVNIKAKNIELSLSLKDYIQEKMDMLEKYLGNLAVINADFEAELISRHHNKGKIYRAEANLEVPGRLLRVEKTEKDLHKAIDKVKDHMALVIKKHKEKIAVKERKSFD